MKHRQNQELLWEALRRTVLVALFLAMGVMVHASAHAFTFTLDVTGPGGGAIGPYRWLVEEDLTFHNDPSATVPAINPDALGLNFHRSYMPVVAQSNGFVSGPASITVPNGSHYFVSVLPKANYAMGGASVKDGQGLARVVVNDMPIPTAQISIFCFHDNMPINNSPDLPEEQGLEGFQIIIKEAAGRFGANGEQILHDAFGNKLGTTYTLDGDGNPVVVQEGSGVIFTDANGVALVKYLPPAKYGVTINPPDGEGWIQTSTIEGTKTIDAWVKANEPPYFTEFGPAGHHTEFGFIKQFSDPTVVGAGTATISGAVHSVHMSRPPAYTFYEGDVFRDAWIGLNDMAVGRGKGVYAAPANASTGAFTIANVAPGNYQLAIWDVNMDIIFASIGVTVNADGTCGPGHGPCALGNVSVFDWFGRLQGRVFYDKDKDGFDDGCVEPDCSGINDEPGLDNQAVNIRWRDGTFYLGTGTDSNGNYSFTEVFPFFSWLVAEVDFARYKATGMTAVADNGGLVLPHDGWDWPSFDRLTPQEQFDININTDNNLSRTETGEVLSQAFSVFLGQTNVMDFGKVAYQGMENGGISGIVFYDTTRAENDPRYNFGETWQPGIPNVQVNLYRDADDDGLIDDQPGTVAGIQMADVDNYPLGWADGGAMGAEDVDRDGNGVFDFGDAIDVAWTDSWDDSQPTDCPGGGPNGGPTVDINGTPDPFYDADNDGSSDCYDGLRNFNQVRPGVFDGGFAFGGYDAETNPEGLLPGIYIVEVAPPKGPDGSETYKVVRSQDKNVDFGEEYTPGALAFPPICVGQEYTVPAELSLFPGEPAPLAGQPLYHCDLKQVDLKGQQNAPVEFFLFTDTPTAAHVLGFILNDLANEFDPNNPNFGEKFALPFVPVSFRDWTGREITRVYSDQYGNYNALVPSTFTANLPSPSGFGPNMLIACMNDPGPIPDPANPGQFITDPYFQPQYTQFCYTFQYMPGATTYLDTPVEPIAAFAGQNQAPLDCEFPNGTPVIASASVPANGVGGGPYASATGQQIVITAKGDTLVTDPAGTGKISRDYGFGDFVAGQSTVTLGNTPLTGVIWTPGSISATIPAGAQTGQLSITRANGLSTTVGVTVTVGSVPGVVRQVGLGQSIQDVIDIAGNGDLVLVRPGNYNESVIMWKDIQLQGWGAPSTIINAVKAPGESIQQWRQDALFLVNNDLVDILPGQELGFDPANNEPDFLTTTEAPGIMVFAKQVDPTPAFDPRIDGFTITGSDIGGGIVVNAYANDLTVSNNRIQSNAGINGGGITVGHPFTADGPEDAHNDNLQIVNNHITQNGSRSGGSGGVALFTGADNYLVSQNFICGNFTSGSGAGIGHNGLCQNGTIDHNDIVFNQAFNQLPATGSSGGGIALTGLVNADGDRTGTGNVTINTNRLQGNLAGAGDGGGIRLSGTDAITDGVLNAYTINIVNNMIVNNVSGFAGAGIGLQDATSVNIVHNTIANNDSTATAGEAFTVDLNLSAQQPAGVVSRAHSSTLAAVTGAGFSNPQLANNIIWHNRAFYWDATANGAIGGLLPNPIAADYWDLGVLGAAGQLVPQDCLLTSLTDFDGVNYNGNGNLAGNPLFVEGYFNGDSTLTAIPEDTTPINTAAATDEGGNFIDVRFGPLQVLGDYHIYNTSPAVDAGAAIAIGGLLNTDFDGDSRLAMAPPDIGADESTLTAPPPPCEGDFNGDGAVNVGDLSVFAGAFGSSTGSPNYNPAADFNGDGTINVGDLSVFANDFGRTDCP